MSKRFIYNHKIGFKICQGYGSHSEYIEQGDYNITVRGYIFYDEKIIYIRINTRDYRGKGYLDNLNSCNKYLLNDYFYYNLYTSYTFDKLPQEIKDYLSMT